MEHPTTHEPEPKQPDRSHDQAEQRPGDQLEVPVDGTPLEKVNAFLRIAFAEADARGEVISTEDAQTVASMLAALLGPSEMRCFAQTGHGDLLALQTECHYLKGRAWKTPDVALWVERFEQYLAARPESAVLSETDGQLDNPQIEQGIREHGDAFRAFVQLPDIDPRRGDLLSAFQESYIGTFASMDALLDELTEIRGCEATLNQVAANWGFDGLAGLDRAAIERMAHEAWTIVEVGGRFHVFIT